MARRQWSRAWPYARDAALTVFGFMILYHEFFLVAVEDFGWQRIIPVVTGAAMAGGTFLTPGGMWERFVERVVPPRAPPKDEPPPSSGSGP